MSAKTRWTIVIVGTFLTWLGEEIWALADASPNTQPFTDIVVHYVPRVVGIPSMVFFALWLGVHFISRWLGHPVATRQDLAAMEGSKVWARSILAERILDEACEYKNAFTNPKLHTQQPFVSDAVAVHRAALFQAISDYEEAIRS